MTLIRERDLEFSFDRPWTVVKWDECEFRKRREHHGAAVDVAAFHASGQLWLFEIKDYPAHPQVVAPVPSDLAEKCSRKVRDSLAQML